MHHINQMVDAAVCLHGMTESLVLIDRVHVASPLSPSADHASDFQFLDDPLDRTLSNANSFCDIADASVRFCM